MYVITIQIEFELTRLRKYSSTCMFDQCIKHPLDTMTVWFQTGKIIVIRLALLGIMGAQLRAPLKPLRPSHTIVLRDLSRPPIYPSLCRKMLISQTADVYFLQFWVRLTHRFCVYPKSICTEKTKFLFPFTLNGI